MEIIVKKLTSIINRLSKYSLEYNDFSNDDLFNDDEYYDDMSEVMNNQRDKLEDLSSLLSDMVEESSEDDKENIKAVLISVNEALNYVEEVAFKANCPWSLDIPEYDSEITEAIIALKGAIAQIEDL